MPSEENLSLGYRCYCQVDLERQNCFRCIEIEEEKKEVNLIEIKSPKTNHIAEGKICPKCQCELVVKQSSFGTFYACGNYPNCKYTESINKIK